MTGRPARDSPTLSWVVLVVLVGSLGAALAAAGLPSPLLFGALLGGLVHALTWSPQPRLPPGSFTLGQAVVGVTVGAQVDFGALRSLGSDWPVIVLVSLGTIVVSVAAGQVLRLHRGVTATTATFAAVAGGAAGIVAMSRDLGADDRVVTVIQYLRVLVILLAMPVVVALVFGSDVPAEVAAASSPATATATADLALSALAIVLGLLLGRAATLPSPAILGPLAVAVGLVAMPAFEGADVPGWLLATGFVLIGVQVGLRFTPESFRAIGRMLPTALAVIAVIILGCAGLGVLLALATGVSPLDAYLATTPGGLYAVLAIAASTDGNVTFVTSVQLLRLLVVLLLAPFVGRWFLRRAR